MRTIMVITRDDDGEREKIGKISIRAPGDNDREPFNAYFYALQISWTRETHTTDKIRLMFGNPALAAKEDLST